MADNLGIDRHELKKLGYYAYRTLVDGAMASSLTVTPVAVEEMDFEDKDAWQPGAIEEEKEEGPEAEGTEKETIGVVEEEAKMRPKTVNIEGLVNAWDT